MKKVIAILIIFILTLGVCFSFGCGDSVEKITDMKRFKGMTEQTDRIDVSYDNHTGKSFEFSITNKTEIDEIMQIVLNTPLNDLGEGSRTGDLTYITIIQGEKEYRMNFSVNKEGKRWYSFKDGALMYKIISFAKTLGAEDYLVGVALAVSGSAEISTNEIGFASFDELKSYIQANYLQSIYLYQQTSSLSNSEVCTNTQKASAFGYKTEVSVPNGSFFVEYNIYRSYKTAENVYIIKPSQPQAISQELTKEYNFAFGSYLLATVKPA